MKVSRILVAVFCCSAISAVAATNYVWSSGSATPPYDTWAKAANDIQTAVSAASDGDLILVTNGGYSVAAEIFITSGIEIRSINGPSVTAAFRPGGSGYRVFNLNHSNAVLSGLSVSNGLINYGSCIVLQDGIVTNCIIEKGQGNRNAAALRILSGLCVNTIIRNNKDTGNSGTVAGVDMNGDGILRNCRIYGNTAMHNSGMRLLGSSRAENCIISNNYRAVVNYYGGENAVNITGSAVMENCIIVNNKGHGVRISGGTLQNCTIVGNTLFTGVGNGVYQTGGTVKNCIVYHNGAGVSPGTDQNVYSSGGTITFSCMKPLVSGSGNTDADPRLRARFFDDWMITPGSPCMDGGTNIAAVTMDYVGTSRPLEGDGLASAEHDIGAYEAAVYNLGSLRCGFTNSAHVGTNSLQVVMYAKVAGVDTSINYYWWDFDSDGTNDVFGATSAIVTNTFTNGFHDITLTVSNSSAEVATVTMVDDVRVVPDIAYVDNVGSHTYPYDTWAKGATNLQAALDSGAPLVLLTNGNFGVDEQTELTWPVTVRGIGADSTVIYRTGVGGGHTIFVLNDAMAVLDSLTVSNGSAGLSAVGGVYMYDGTIQDCVIRNSTGSRNAGGIYMSGGTLKNSTIRDNKDTSNSGTIGGARMTGGVISNCVFFGNKGGSDVGACGALWLQGGIATHCIITNNIYGSNGSGGHGGVRMNGGTLQNCLIADNDGRGIYLYGPGAVRNCTVSGNSIANNQGNGILMIDGTVENTIAYFNGASLFVADNVNILTNGGVVRYSCMYPLIGGEGNTNADPRFISVSTQNYQLNPGSPSLDSGTNAASVVNDLLYAVRPSDGNGDSTATHDMGCYEMQPGTNGSLRCGFTVSAHEGTDSLESVFAAYVLGTNTTINFYWWDFENDGTNDLTGATASVATNTFLVGFYDVLLTVSNSAGEIASCLMINDIRVKSGNAYVATNGSHTSPYDTWAKAATNVSDALSSGATKIYISNGTFSVNSRLDLISGITVTGVNGREATTIRRSGVGGNHVVFLVDHTDAVVEGITIENGRYGVGSAGNLVIYDGTVRDCTITNGYGSRAPGGIQMTGGMVSNCIIRKNYDTSNSGTIGGVRMSGGLLIDCIIDRNRGGSDVGAVGGVRISGGVMRNCVITNNIYGTAGIGGAGGVTVTGGTVENCLIANNNGRGVYMATAGKLINCTITGNEISDNSGNGIKMTAGLVTNCIVYFNGASQFIEQNEDINLGGGTVTYSCMYPLVAGANNISSDPRFRTASSNDYTLTPGSTSIDAGTNLVGVTRDLIGTSRPLDGDGVGGAIHDMGCYEALDATNGVLRCGFVASDHEGPSPHEVVFTAYAAGTNTTITYYWWDFDNDGSADVEGAGLAVVTNSFGPGIHDVSLIVSNSFGFTATAVQYGDIRVAPDTAYVSTNGAHTAPYDTWAKAATNLAAALDAGSSTIIMSNGMFQVDEKVSISRKLTIRSMNGPVLTKILRSGVGGNHEVVYMNHTNAVLDGLGIKDGAYGLGSCGGIYMLKGLVKNCIIQDSYGSRGPGGLYLIGGVVTNTIIKKNVDTSNSGTIGGVKITGGKLVKCVLDGNRGGSDTGAAGGLWMTGGLVQDCTIISNKYGTGGSGSAGGVKFAGGTLRNSLVIGNTGKGINQTLGTMDNCTIARNSLEGLAISGGTATNVIVWYNGSGDISGSPGILRYSCSPDVTHNPGGTGNITNAPSFEDSGSGFGQGFTNGNYRLTRYSPCVNGGINLGWMTETATDLDGEVRVDSKIVDMGAYETYVPFPGTVFIFR